MLLCDEFRQRKALMIVSIVVMSALAAGQPGKSIRAESPRALDKASSRPDRKST
jgi:hypothetical protein